MKKLLVVALLAALSGCAALDYNSGVKVDDATYNSFQPFSTKEMDVVNKLGSPQSTQVVGDKKIYTYTYSTISGTPFAPNHSTRVMLTFKNGALVNKSKTESNVVAAGSNPLTGG